MDGLTQAINRAESLEREQADKAKEFDKPSEPDGSTVAQVDPLEAAGNMAESLLRVAEGACKAFIDSRLCLDDAEVLSGRESLGPAIDKYGLARGNGKIPFSEEISAGFYIGGLWRRFRRALGELRAKDKAEAKAREQANNGDKREYQSQEPPRAVPSQVGVRQEPDANTERWNTEQWGQGGSLGQ